MVVGLGALAGWQFDVAWLKSVAPGQATMNPVTALALVLLGIALYLSPGDAPSPPSVWAARTCAAAVALLGLVRLAAYLFRVDPGIDRLLFAERVALSPGHSSSVAPQTALNCLLVGAALLWRSRDTARARLGVQLLALASGFIALVGITAHAYGTRLLYGAMALNTAFAFLIAAAGVLWSRPDHGVAALAGSATAGGVLVRRLIPAMIAITLVLGWLRLAGERAGLYDTAGGTALLATGMIAAFAALAWWSARSLDRADTERRAAEQALRDSELRLFQILEAMPVAVFVLDGTGRPYYANQASQDILGKGIVPDATPDRLPDVYHACVAGTREPYPAERTPIVRALRGERTHVTDIEIHRRDRRVPIEAWAAPVTDAAGRVAFAIAAFSDITERRRAEEALRTSEERFRAVAATANDAIISADGSGRITYFNPGAERMFGYAADDVAGGELTVLMPERFRDAHRAGLARYLSTGEARVVGKTVELVGRRENGTEFPLELSLASWNRESGVAFTGIIRDVTERKQAEETARRYAAQLEAANAELDAFAYSVSHDLRAPLRSIDGFSLALLDDSGERLDQAGRDHLKRVRAATQRMGVLIDDLLRLARVSRTELQRAPVDVSALARSVVAELARGAPERQVKVAIADGLVADADPRLLRVVFENLLGNAWKYTGKQPGGRIEVGTGQRDGERAFHVRDDGVGFDMAYAGKLFGAFQRLHSGAEFEGTGVGLATVQRIVHRHGGRVWAESAVGQGATFYFTL
ncbi:MAG TPA: PAS domain S-box protein [Gemmatimonadales bacterium]|nr:PAS domain S-box protein [Gemmatimonadales bacterium]